MEKVNVSLIELIMRLPHETFCNQFHADKLEICSCAKRKAVNLIYPKLFVDAKNAYIAAAQEVK